MISTLSTDETQKIADFLDEHPHLARGRGTVEEPCSLVAINLALTGELTDRIPKCMSPVIGLWIIHIQDRMPAEIRDSAEWRELLPLAAGTGQQKNLEEKRLGVIMDWMWETVLPVMQPVADADGFGEEWRVMLTERTVQAARDARDAAYAYYDANANRAAYVAYAVRDAFEAAQTVQDAHNSLDIAWAIYVVAHVTFNADRADRGNPWTIFDPVNLLRKLIETTEGNN